VNTAREREEERISIETRAKLGSTLRGDTTNFVQSSEQRVEKILISQYLINVLTMECVYVVYISYWIVVSTVIITGISRGEEESNQEREVGGKELNFHLVLGKEGVLATNYVVCM
jgi:hypothetical protein